MQSQIIEEDIKEICVFANKTLNKLEGKNILISGATSMLGSYLVYTLLYANRSLFSHPVKLSLITRKKKPFGDDSNIHYVMSDLAREPLNIESPDYIIHAASPAAPKLYMKQMIDTMNINILGLYNVLSLVKKNTKGILFFSSGEIYGDTGKKMIDETYQGTTDHLNSRSCYVEAKKAGETICMNYYWEKKLPIKIARIFHTFGPGLNLSDGRMFSDFLSAGLTGKSIMIKGNSRSERPILYIKDATVMFLKILTGSKNGQVYNVANDKNIVTVESFANIVSEVIARKTKKKITIKFSEKGDVSYYKNAVASVRPSIEKFKRDFNYTPKTSIVEAVERTVDYLLTTKNEEKRREA